MVYRIYLSQARPCRHCGRMIEAGTTAHRISLDGDGPDGNCIFVHRHCSAPWEKYQRDLMAYRAQQGQQEAPAQQEAQIQEAQATQATRQMVMNMPGMAGNEYGRR